jgi:hypothetical protein
MDAGMVAGQDTAHSGDTDLVEVIAECRREVELTVSVEMLSHPDEIGGETLSTDVVETLGDDAQGTLHLLPAGAATLPVAWLTSQWAIQQTDKALAVQISDGLHFSQKASSLFSVGLSIALSHTAKVLVAFVNGHVIFGGHSSLPVTLSVERTISPR